jgi:hypothetical protein
MRAVGSSTADPYSTTAAAIAVLSGPLHGGANEEVASYTVPFRSDASIWPLCFQYNRPKPLKTRLDFELVFG